MGVVTKRVKSAQKKRLNFRPKSSESLFYLVVSNNYTINQKMKLLEEKWKKAITGAIKCTS